MSVIVVPTTGLPHVHDVRLLTCFLPYTHTHTHTHTATHAHTHIHNVSHMNTYTHKNVHLIATNTLNVHPKEDSGSGSGSESGSEEEEGTTTAASGAPDPQKIQEMAAAAGVNPETLDPDALSKAKQSRSEKKARKAMLKLGLKSHGGKIVDEDQ